MTVFTEKLPDFLVKKTLHKQLTFDKKYVCFKITNSARYEWGSRYGKRKERKQTLRKKMMVVMLISTMSSILAVVIVSYMTIRMIRNDSIQESMQIYLGQITRETDSAYYDMISIVNQMSPSGLIGNVVESYLSAEDNFDKYKGQKSLREELVKLGYVNTKLLGVTYYDPKSKVN